jgi:hypothetical protein
MTTLSNGSFLEKFAAIVSPITLAYRRNGSTAKGYRTGAPGRIRIFVITRKNRRIGPTGTPALSQPQ